MSHKGKATSDVNYNPEDGPEAYSNASVHSRLSDYTSMAREVHGPEFDPSTEDLDGEVVMRVGGGKKHGRYWIADGAIDSSSTPTLSQIRARSTSASPAIQPRQNTSQYQIQALQVIPSLFVLQLLLYTFSLYYCNIWVKILQNQLAEERRLREASDQRMRDILVYMQSLGTATGVAPPASLYAPPPPPDPFSTPVSVDKFLSCIVVIYLVSLAIFSICRINRRHQMIQISNPQISLIGQLGDLSCDL